MTLQQREDSTMPVVSMFRLYLLRAVYLLVVVGLGLMIWPLIIQHTGSWQLMPGVVKCMLGAFSLLALLGIRYPLQMLPILFWELGWKLIWLIRVALPAWSSGTMDDATAETLFECAFVVIIPIAIPWRYVMANYVRKAGDPWRGGAVAR
ncbi:MAG: hypothetical protein ABI411_13930 [Tahibacter sp.]